MAFQKDASYAFWGEPDPLGRMPSHPAMLYERIQIKNLSDAVTNEGTRYFTALVTAAALAASGAGLLPSKDLQVAALPLEASAAFALATGVKARRRLNRAQHHLEVTENRHNTHKQLAPAFARCMPPWQITLKDRQIEAISHTHEQANDAHRRCMWGLSSNAIIGATASFALAGAPPAVPVIAGLGAAACAVAAIKFRKTNPDTHGWTVVRQYEDSAANRPSMEMQLAERFYQQLIEKLAFDKNHNRLTISRQNRGWGRKP